ncbi:hypothetical protein GLW36_12935 [Halorubrum terrestre]|uniref:PGF-CTERM archaeal protein-sorting signal domain-containing protein n=1 Tax=Halorubrum distributum TaxID=29283 RepID=A0A6B1I9L4_9EURY|nr:PGF-CTERM sorting domain-containing protein [Halorubrum terrestre]MYL17542.1 hypothetical protein [Halorubrum terrestre]
MTVNTYASPESPSEFVTTGSGIDVESVTGDTAPLSPGTYDLTLRSEHGTEVGTDTATVTVEPRSTSDLTAYTTRSVASGEFENASAVREAIADGTLTPATTATANDTVVYAVNATGLTGLPAAANASLERGADLDRLDGLSFGVAPTGADDGDESTDGDGLGRTLNGSGIHLDRQGLYLVVDGERAFGTETLPEPGATFEAEFRVDDDRLRRTAADDRHRAATELTYATDSTDGSIATESGDDSTEASASTDSEASGSTSSTGGSDAIGGGSAGGGSTGGSSTGGGSTGGGSTGGGSTGGSSTGGSSTGGSSTGGSSTGGGSTGGSSTGGSSTGGGSTGGSSTGGPSAPGGGANPAGSAAAGNATNAGGPAPSEESLGPDANRPAPRLGMGISIAPGTSEIPPSVGPPEVFGTGGPERGAGGPTGAESRSEHGRPNDAGGGEGDDATSAGPADSVESPESSAAGDQSATGDSSPDEADASDLGYDEAPIRSTAYDLPGFDAVASLAALAGASLLARRRGRES